MNKDADNISQQVFYQGRWVSRENFRVFIYKDDDKKLVNSYDEFERFVQSGEWFPSPNDIKPANQPKAGRMKKHASTDS